MAAAPWPAATGFVVGGAVPPVLATLLMVAVDPGAEPALPSRFVLLPTAAAGLVGAAMGALMARSASRRADASAPRG